MGRKRGSRRRAISIAQPFVLAVVCLLGLLGVGRVLAATVPSPLAGTAPSAHVQSIQAAGLATDRRPDCTQKPCIALTFDDGPNAVLTPQVLDVLLRHDARATFFVVGMHVPGNEALLRRMHAEGHEIGNHSWSHTDMTTLPVEQMRQQIYDTQAAVTAAGVPAPRLFRAPYGVVDDVVRSQVPLSIVQWNIDPEDWHHHKETQHIVEHMGSYAKPGGVVVMHDTQARTLQALDPMLTHMGQAYQFVTISDLLHLAPGQSGMFYGR